MRPETLGCSCLSDSITSDRDEDDGRRLTDVACENGQGFGRGEGRGTGVRSAVTHLEGDVNVDIANLRQERPAVAHNAGHADGPGSGVHCSAEGRLLAIERH